MKVHQPYTLTGIFLLLTSAVLWGAGVPLLPQIAAQLGLFLCYYEVRKVTGNLQFIGVFAGALLTGIPVDLEAGSYPWASLSVTFSAIALLLRIVAFRFFAYTRYIYTEITIVLIAALFYLGGCLSAHFYWQVLLFPLPVWLVSLLFSYGVVKDKQQLVKAAMGGYKVKTGFPAPDFSLPDEKNELVSLDQFKNQRNLLLIFVRGDWCPGCHMMLRTYEKNRERFAEKNILVMAIGPDPVGVNKSMVEKLNLDYKILADDGQRTAMRYGVQVNDYKNTFSDTYGEGIPLPASFLIDTKGVVRYVSRPDRIGEFLNPSLIFPVINQLKNSN